MQLLPHGMQDLSLTFGGAAGFPSLYAPGRIGPDGLLHRRDEPENESGRGAGGTLKDERRVFSGPP